MILLPLSPGPGALVALERPPPVPGDPAPWRLQIIPEATGPGDLPASRPLCPRVLSHEWSLARHALLSDGLAGEPVLVAAWASRQQRGHFFLMATGPDPETWRHGVLLERALGSSCCGAASPGMPDQGPHDLRLLSLVAGPRAVMWCVPHGSLLVFDLLADMGTATATCACSGSGDPVTPSGAARLAWPDPAWQRGPRTPLPVGAWLEPALQQVRVLSLLLPPSGPPSGLDVLLQGVHLGREGPGSPDAGRATWLGALVSGDTARAIWPPGLATRLGLDADTVAPCQGGLPDRAGFRLATGPPDPRTSSGDRLLALLSTARRVALVWHLPADGRPAATAPRLLDLAHLAAIARPLAQEPSRAWPQAENPPSEITLTTLTGGFIGLSVTPVDPPSPLLAVVLPPAGAWPCREVPLLVPSGSRFQPRALPLVLADRSSGVLVSCLVPLFHEPASPSARPELLLARRPDDSSPAILLEEDFERLTASRSGWRWISITDDRAVPMGQAPLGAEHPSADVLSVEAFRQWHRARQAGLVERMAALVADTKLLVCDFGRDGPATKRPRVAGSLAAADLMPSGHAGSPSPLEAVWSADFNLYDDEAIGTPVCFQPRSGVAPSSKHSPT
ncbi:hypothetical protein H696_03831 [Fonticula alba]|uniref:Uncharacterized protein n=1 Tax=Fonticula alba TaxID=691883 RepID=A0A058Z565_FONAL|nr:hypothetical protein H696_03831 [Fonticula alba]KCV69400.1 hypothetical protein H696_03831 [Fonticula alba]|eukprot:XP_009495965.1 hypothetical protein H696_03831 [Fonticula alba]